MPKSTTLSPVETRKRWIWKMFEFKIWKKPMLVLNKWYLSKKPLISALIWYPKSGRGIIMRLSRPPALKNKSHFWGFCQGVFKSMLWKCLTWLFKLHKKWMKTILKPYAISQDIWLLKKRQLLIGWLTSSNVLPLFDITEHKAIGYLVFSR